MRGRILRDDRSEDCTAQNGVVLRLFAGVVKSLDGKPPTTTGHTENKWEERERDRKRSPRRKQLVSGPAFILLHLEILRWACTGCHCFTSGLPRCQKHTGLLSLAWCRSVALLRRYVSTISHCNLPTSKIGLLPIRGCMCASRSFKRKQPKACVRDSF